MPDTARGQRRRVLGPWLGLLAFFALVILAWRGGIHLSMRATADPLASRTLFAATVSVASLALIAMALRMHRRHLDWLGVTQKGAFKAACAGVLIYVLPAAAMLLVCITTNQVSVSPQVPVAELLSGVLLVATFVFASEALPEELLFRGYAWARLSEALPTWAVIVVQAMVFLIAAILMGAVATPLDASFLATFALVLGVLRAATGSLWAPVVFHWVFMTTQQATGNSWGLFTVDRPQTLQMLLAMVPFSVAIIWLHRRVAWVRGPSTDGTRSRQANA